MSMKRKVVFGLLLFVLLNGLLVFTSHKNITTQTNQMVTKYDIQKRCIAL